MSFRKDTIIVRACLLILSVLVEKSVLSVLLIGPGVVRKKSDNLHLPQFIQTNYELFPELIFFFWGTH